MTRTLRASQQNIRKQIESGSRKRTEAQREVDLIAIAEMYVKGYTADSIMQYIHDNRPYTLSRAMISYDIRAIHERWLHAQLINMDEAKSRELSKIDRVEQAAWEAWEKSITVDDTITESTRIEDNAAALRNAKATTYTRGKVNKLTKTAKGNPRYLDMILKCVDQRCRILGVYAPDKLTLSWEEEARKVGIDPEKLQDDLAEQFVRAAGLGSPAGDTGGDTEK